MTNESTPLSRQDLIRRATTRYDYRQELPPDELELVDPLQIAVRTLIPIPNEYYWNITRDSHLLPRSIRWWHQSIYLSERVGTALQVNVGQPLARFLGFEESRIQYVVDVMEESDMEASKRTMEERKQQDGDASGV